MNDAVAQIGVPQQRSELPSGDSRVASGYLPTLDGWRSVAIMMVILTHANAAFVLASGRIYIPQLGYQGVQLFFALSGVLICTLLLREKTASGSIDLRRFYVRRGFRILPAALTYLATIAVLAICGALVAKPGEFVASLLFYRNYYNAFGMPAGHDTGHFWSLSVEEQFYLVTPFLLLVLSRRTLMILLPLFACAIAVWRGVDSHMRIAERLIPGLQFDAGRTDLCLDALLWGCWAAVISDAALHRPAIQRMLEHRAVQAGVFIVFLAAMAFEIPSRQTLFAVTAPALLVCTVHNPTTLLGRALEWRPLRWLGRISYSLYLWQELFLIQLGGPELSYAGWLKVIQTPPLCFMCTLLLALGSYYFIETPLRKWGYARFGGSREPVAASGGPTA